MIILFHFFKDLSLKKLNKTIIPTQHSKYFEITFTYLLVNFKKTACKAIENYEARTIFRLGKNVI